MITIQLPKAQDEWVESRVRKEEYVDSSDAVTDLVRRDRDREHRIAELRCMIDASLSSGISALRVGDIIEVVDRRRAVE